MGAPGERKGGFCLFFFFELTWVGVGEGQTKVQRTVGGRGWGFEDTEGADGKGDSGGREVGSVGSFD